MKPTRAVITGASSGIGEEFAKTLAGQRVNLVIVARRTERLEQLANELMKEHGITVEVMTLDLTETDAPEKLFQMATKNGPVDLLINNAGAGPYRHFLKTDLNEHKKIMTLNMNSLTVLTHLFVTHMIENGKDAAVLNVASVASYTPVPRYAVYCATKSYVRIFSEILNYELQDTKVSVTCLCPGGTHTEFLEKNNQSPKKGSDLFMMSARKVAEAGLKATYERKSIVIPGLFNKISSALPAIVPNSIGMLLSEKAMQTAVDEKN